MEEQKNEQKEEQKQKSASDIIFTTCEKMCLEFCKYSGNYNSLGQCIYQQEHDECPLDMIL